ncbi:maleylacetoacetate isomerase [archaeon]|nr:MAG: maleylacetoacetate isomerase [archaeon]
MSALVDKPVYTLYHYFRSSCSWRVRMALLHKNIPCNYVHVNILKGEHHSEEHLARNPLGYVPVLQIDDPVTNTSNFIAESTAIIQYLEDMHPLPPLLPGDALQRAHIRQLVEIVNAGTQPLQNMGVMKKHSADVDEQKIWNAHWIAKGLHAFETLASKSAGRYCVGDEITMADFFLVPQCYNARRFGIDMANYPLLERIDKDLSEMPNYQDAHPDKFN